MNYAFDRLTDEDARILTMICVTRFFDADSNVKYDVCNKTDAKKLLNIWGVTSFEEVDDNDNVDLSDTFVGDIFKVNPDFKDSMLKRAEALTVSEDVNINWWLTNFAYNKSSVLELKSVYTDKCCKARSNSYFGGACIELMLTIDGKDFFFYIAGKHVYTTKEKYLSEIYPLIDEYIGFNSDLSVLNIQDRSCGASVGFMLAWCAIKANPAFQTKGSESGLAGYWFEASMKDEQPVLKALCTDYSSTWITITPIIRSSRQGFLLAAVLETIGLSNIIHDSNYGVKTFNDIKGLLDATKTRLFGYGLTTEFPSATGVKLLVTPIKYWKALLIVNQDSTGNNVGWCLTSQLAANNYSYKRDTFDAAYAEIENSPAPSKAHIIDEVVAKTGIKLGETVLTADLLDRIIRIVKGK